MGQGMLMSIASWLLCSFPVSGSHAKPSMTCYHNDNDRQELGSDDVCFLNLVQSVLAAYLVPSNNINARLFASIMLKI
jgi:hypothetical protein